MEMQYEKTLVGRIQKAERIMSELETYTHIRVLSDSQETQSIARDNARNAQAHPGFV
jgi:hypothetical protein